MRKLPPLFLSRGALAGIALVAAGVSYLTQRDLLLDHEADWVTASAIPLTVDLAVINCSLIINSEGVDPEARRLAWAVLGAACAVSIAANCYAGDNVIQRIAHVWCVVIYLGTEAVAARSRARRAPAPAKRPARAAAKPAPQVTTGQEVVKSAEKPPRARGRRTPVTPMADVEASKTERGLKAV